MQMEQQHRQFRNSGIKGKIWRLIIAAHDEAVTRTEKDKNNQQSSVKKKWYVEKKKKKKKETSIDI